MKITITAHMLCELCGGKFTLEACEALCNRFEEMYDDTFAPFVGDICVCYSEIEADAIDEDDEEKSSPTLTTETFCLLCKGKQIFFKKLSKKC